MARLRQLADGSYSIRVSEAQLDLIRERMATEEGEGPEIPEGLSPVQRAIMRQALTFRSTALEDLVLALGTAEPDGDDDDGETAGSNGSPGRGAARSRAGAR